MTVTLSDVYLPSDHIVTRIIEGEIILVPLTAGVGENDDALFTLNQTGQAIWEHLDGRRSLSQVIDDLVSEYDQADAGVIEEDVLGLVQELLKQKMLTQL